MVPTILLTTNPSYNYDPEIPEQCQPRIIETENPIPSLEKIITTEIDAYEENVIDIEKPEKIENYTKLLLGVASAEGKYDKGTHQHFTRILMGDNYGDNYSMNGGQAGSIGPNAHVYDFSFNQIWNESKNDVDLNELAEDLKKLLPKLNAEAKTTENYVSLGNIAEAELSARNGDGPKAYEYLQKAGKWTFDIACQIAVPVATDVLKKILGI